MAKGGRTTIRLLGSCYSLLTKHSRLRYARVEAAHFKEARLRYFSIRFSSLYKSFLTQRNSDLGGVSLPLKKFNYLYPQVQPPHEEDKIRFPLARMYVHSA